MYISALYYRMRKFLIRLPTVLALRHDYFTRWLPQMHAHGASWRGYINAIRSSQRQCHARERLAKELGLLEDVNNEVVVAISWLSPGDEYTPYVCQKCYEMDTGSLFRFETVRPKRKDGTVSMIYRLSYRCLNCSNREYVHNVSFKPKSPSKGIRDTETYGVSYDVCHGEEHYTRRQLRYRENDEVKWVRATVWRPGTPPETRVPNPIITNIAVDGVLLPEEHELYSTLIRKLPIDERIHYR
jgi:hypothetical protein